MELLFISTVTLLFSMGTFWLIWSEIKANKKTENKCKPCSNSLVQRHSRGDKCTPKPLNGFVPTK
jgi:hypothetical protein